MIGSAAAVAAATVPLVAQKIIEPAFVTPVPAQQNFLRRAIYDIWASCDTQEDGLAELSLYRGENKIFEIALNQRSMFRWVAPPLEALVISQHETLRIEFRSACGLGEIHMICHDWIDDGDPIEVCEEHRFPARGEARVLPLYPDNSPQARRERAMARNTPSKYDPSDDDIDEWPDD